MNIKNFDLNLLRVLDALLQECSVTRAAQSLHLSQPAVSNALARLRAQTGDPLFIREAAGLRPTPRAQAMTHAIRETLTLIEATLTPPQFEPATEDKTFAVAMPDCVALHLLPELTAHVRRVAPKIKLAIHSLVLEQVSDALLKGQHDLAIGHLGGIAEQLYRQPLQSESLVCMVRQGHPRIEGSLSMAQFLAEEHAMVSQSGAMYGPMDGFLATRGMARKVVVSIPHVGIAPRLLLQSDLIITLPKHTAKKILLNHALQILPLPLAVPEYEVSLAWPARHQNDPAHRWLRETIHHTVEHLNQGTRTERV